MSPFGRAVGVGKLIQARGLSAASDFSEDYARIDAKLVGIVHTLTAARRAGATVASVDSLLRERDALDIRAQALVTEGEPIPSDLANAIEDVAYRAEQLTQRTTPIVLWTIGIAVGVTALAWFVLKKGKVL